MIKFLIRFALIWTLTLLISPYIDRWLSQLARRAPQDSFIQEILLEISGRYSSSLIRSFGETVGELVLGAKK